MTLNRLVALLPSYSLEDLELHRPAGEAEQLLSGWSALWHPALVAAARVTPSWVSADNPPEEPAGHVIVVPPCCEARLQADWIERAESAGAVLVRNLPDRGRLVAALVERLERLGRPVPTIDADLVGDFHALGFCHLMVELLTRQLRYMSNLDEAGFQTKLLEAAEGAVAGDRERAEQSLEGAFRLLSESREYFYPVESHLLDLTLVAPTTLGAALAAELAGRLPTNLLLGGRLVERLAEEQPGLLAELRAALDGGRAALVGGEYDETELPLLTPEEILAELRRGLAAYERHLGRRPTVFGRRHFGLSPALPQVLRLAGFTAALHFTLDDGKFPAGNQSRIQWEGFGDASIEALGRVPFDVSQADAFLRLPERLGNSMDLDHVATVVLAHWPGQSSPWYDDLRRVAKYSSVLGKFSTIDDYFQQTSYSSQRARHEPDEYRSPYLKQAVAAGQPDPISRWVRRCRAEAAREAVRSLDAMAAMIAPAGPPPGADQGDPAASLADLERRLAEPCARLGQALGARSGGDPGGGPGCLVLNPLSFPRRVLVEAQRLDALPDVAEPVRAADASTGQKLVLVDVPGTGFAWFGPGMGEPGEPTPPTPKRRRWFRRPKEEPPMAEEHALRNEFCRIAIDPATGALRSIADYATRGPRLAQQIAMRIPRRAESDDPGDDVHYTIMAAERIEVTAAGPLVGEIVCRGRLMDRQGHRVAGYRQTTRVVRGSRVVELEIEIDVERPPEADPWNSYYAARFAWSDSTAEIHRSVSLGVCPTEIVQLEAPHLIDIRGEKTRTSLLCGGLPYHRRFGLRKLDALLVVAGERERRFRLGIGIDLERPVEVALEMLAPATTLWDAACPTSRSGWLFHLDTRGVVATHWEPLVEEGCVAGFRARLLETAGRAVRAGLRCFRPLASARKFTSSDGGAEELVVEGDRTAVPLRPRQWAEIEARLAVQYGNRPAPCSRSP
jgi:alpha-mannosidase